jgi:hypothetical protein
LGAYAQGVRLSGPETAATVPLDQTTSRKVLESFRSGLESTTPREPDRVFLNLENIKASSDAASFSVYIGLKPEETGRSSGKSRRRGHAVRRRRGDSSETRTATTD